MRGLLKIEWRRDEIGALIDFSTVSISFYVVLFYWSFDSTSLHAFIQLVDSRLRHLA